MESLEWGMVLDESVHVLNQELREDKSKATIRIVGTYMGGGKGVNALRDWKEKRKVLSGKEKDRISGWMNAIVPKSTTKIGNEKNGSHNLTCAFKWRSKLQSTAFERFSARAGEE